MRLLAPGNRRTKFATLFGGFLVIVGVSFFGSGVFTVQNANAILVGDPGPAPTSSGSGNGYYDRYGHGWRLYTIGGAGPASFVDGNTWASVSTTCSNTGANKVWAYAIRNPAGQERIYTFGNTFYYYRNNFNPDNNTGGARYYPSKPWWIDRPQAGGSPYVYNTAGQYDGIPKYGGASGYGAADSVVQYVRGLYLGEGGNNDIWGWNVGWFCYSDNPPWTVSAATTVNKTIAEVGETITWTHRVTNNGAGTTNVNIAYTALNKPDFSAGTAGSWTFTTGKARNASEAQTSSYTVLASDFGKTLCRSTRASPSANTGGSTESSPTCVTIIKKPKVQVLGGDLFVGRGSASNPGATSNVVTSVSLGAGALYYGSWSEYGIVPTGTVTGMASGAGLAGGVADASLCSVSKLTFVNSGTGTCSPASVGRYSSSSTVPNVQARFPVSSSTLSLPSTNVSLMGSNLSGLYKATTPTRISGGSAISAGRWIVINAKDTDITITNNINYTTASLSSIADIPQVVIIARNIIIADNVTNVDAWLVAVGSGADGRINTCGAGSVNETTAVNATVCNNKLTVNGPIVANHLLMRRTSGADSGNPGQPAEVFNLRADSYIWASSYSPGTGRLPTVVTTELPPRF